MSDIRSELALSAVDLEATALAAMHSVRPEGGSPASLMIRSVYELPQRQAVLEGVAVGVGSYRNEATLTYCSPEDDGSSEGGFGGLTAVYKEPIPAGQPFHQYSHSVRPVPYIKRELSLRDDVLTVDTASVHPPAGIGPVVVENVNAQSLYRATTRYNTQTGAATFVSGERTYVLGHLVCDDTQERNIDALPEAARENRLATMARTTLAVLAMFDGAASGNAQHEVKVYATE